jgi:4'-phosphopantetheinyl transferase
MMPIAAADLVVGESWQVAAPGFHPANGDIVLWWLDLSRPSLDAAALASRLTDPEAAEVARFHRPEDRLQRAGARAFLRFVLGTYYLGVPPRDVAWTRDAQGRPQLADAVAGPLDFNLSHAGSHVLVGVSTAGRIGVDVEIATAVDVPALAQTCATDSERRWLASAGGEAEERQRFFRLWTMKEAVLKCHGLGLGFDPRRCELDPASGRARLRVPAQEAASFSASPLEFVPGVVGAVAWTGDSTRSLHCRRAPDTWIEA